MVCPTCAAIQALLNAGGLAPEYSQAVGRAVGRPIERKAKKVVKRKASKWNKHVKAKWREYRRKHPNGKKSFGQIVKAAKRSYKK